MVLFASLILLSFARYSAFPITAEVQTVLMIKSFTNMVGKDLIEEYFVGDGDGDVTRSLYEDTRVCLLSVSKRCFSSGEQNLVAYASLSTARQFRTSRLYILQ